MNLESVLFFIFSSLILVTAALVAFRPRPIESVMWLVLNFFLTAGLYVLLGSHFVATIQVLVYAGAIMVLFVFVVLLLNLDPREWSAESSTSWTSLALFIGFLSFILLSLRVTTPDLLNLKPVRSTETFGSVEEISRILVTKYFWGFELAGVLLLLSILGVGLLAYHRGKKHT